MPGGAPVDVPLFFTDDETIYFSSPVEVKLLLFSGRMGAPAGHSLLFAVGAGPPHDGVRKARRLNLSHDLAGVPPAGSGLSTRSPRPSSPQERSGVPSWGEFLVLVLLPVQAAARAAAGFRPKRNSVSSLHMRWRMTASLRATATRARAMPRVLATFIPQARRLDHLRLRTSRVCAAS